MRKSICTAFLQTHIRENSVFCWTNRKTVIQIQVHYESKRGRATERQGKKCQYLVSTEISSEIGYARKRRGRLFKLQFLISFSVLGFCLNESLWTRQKRESCRLSDSQFVCSVLFRCRDKLNWWGPRKTEIETWYIVIGAATTTRASFQFQGKKWWILMECSERRCVHVQVLVPDSYT